MKKLMLAAAVAPVPLAGCAEMTTTQQRALSGTAIGAGAGAIIGAIAVNAGLGAGIGAAAGLAGGLINKVKQDQAAFHNAGYQAGATGQAPPPPGEARSVVSRRAGRHIMPSSSLASSLIFSGPQGGVQTSLTRTSWTPGTDRIAVSTSPGMLAATGQAGVVNVIST